MASFCSPDLAGRAPRQDAPTLKGTGKGRQKRLQRGSGRFCGNGSGSPGQRTCAGPGGGRRGGGRLAARRALRRPAAAAVHLLAASVTRAAPGALAGRGARVGGRALPRGPVYVWGRAGRAYVWEGGRGGLSGVGGAMCSECREAAHSTPSPGCPAEKSFSMRSAAGARPGGAAGLLKTAQQASPTAAARGASPLIRGPFNTI